MNDQVPLAHVLHVLPLESGKHLMRALRRSVQIECRQVQGASSLLAHVLVARYGDQEVQTRPHQRIEPPLVDELMDLLAPLVEIPLTQTRAS